MNAWEGGLMGWLWCFLGDGLFLSLRYHLSFARLMMTIGLFGEGVAGSVSTIMSIL